jgi:hypothetical protein
MAALPAAIGIIPEEARKAFQSLAMGAVSVVDLAFRTQH